MSEILRAAVIGCGYISPVHLRGYKRLPNVKDRRRMRPD